MLLINSPSLRPKNPPKIPQKSPRLIDSPAMRPHSFFTLLFNFLIIFFLFSMLKTRRVGQRCDLKRVWSIFALHFERYMFVVSFLRVFHWLEKRIVKKCIVFSFFNKSVTEEQTNWRTNRWTNPLIEMRGRI